MFCMLEYVDGGDLQAWMDDERLYAGTMEERQSRLTMVTHQLACGVQHLHSRAILHKDIKPDNITVGLNREAVLIDFGVSAKYD